MFCNLICLLLLIIQNGFLPAGYPAGYPANETGYLVGYKKKAGYPVQPYKCCIFSIYDGLDEYSPLIGKFCGSGFFPQSIVGKKCSYPKL